MLVLGGIRVGSLCIKAVLILGQFGGELVGGRATAELLIQAVERCARLGLKLGQGIARFLFLRTG